MPVQKTSGQGHNMVSRSNSLLGTIKSILPSKLPWFGSSSDQADTLSKRKQVEEQLDVEEESRGAKRQRMAEASTEGRRTSGGSQPRVPASQSGYLDPPQNAFGGAGSARAPRAPPLQVRASSAAAPSRHQREGFKSRVLSPGLGGRFNQANKVVRTQSMDPPSRYRSPSYKPVLSPVPLARDVSMEDVSHTETPSSASRPFRMRTSLTPQLTDQTFGPSRKERDTSEPPPLAALIEKPVFVRAPTETTRQAIPLARQGSLTLGTVAEAQRVAKPLQRSHSSLMIGTDPDMQDVQQTSIVATTAAEKALQELEVYKTPLLPTRLRGSHTVPDMFKPKRVHAPVLMHDRDQKPRLGMADKTGGSGKAPEESQGVKPYAGRGGMKKLLARRRQEEEDEQEKEREQEQVDSIVTDEEVDTRQKEKEQDLGAKLTAELKTASVQEPESKELPSTSIGGREQPSLRVGRTRTSRNHIARPRLKAQAGRFSALYEEDEDDAMEEAREVKLPTPPERIPSLQVPASFSFAKETASIQVIPANAKEPPISNLPFSLTNSASAGTSGSSALFAKTSQAEQKTVSLPLTSAFAKPTAAPSAPVATDTMTVAAPAPSTPMLAAVPQIAVVPPSPARVPVSQSSIEMAPGATAKAPSIPNFFANSALLSKSATTITTPSFSLVSPATTPAASTKQPPSSLFGPTRAQKEDTDPASTTPRNASIAPPELNVKPSTTLPFSFGKTPIAPSSAFPTPPASAAPSADTTKEKEGATATPPPPMTTPSIFNFNSSSQSVVQPVSTPDVPFSFGTPAKPAEPAASASTPFSFGTPSKQTPSSAPFAFSTPVKADTAKVEAESRPTTGDASRAGTSLFGIAPVAPQPVTPFAGFGAPAAPVTPGPPKSAFAFGLPAVTAPVSAPASPAPSEAPKPLFGGPTTAFSFNQPATVTPAPAKSPFQFGAAPSTPTNENKPFTFGSPATPANSTLFGNTANGTSAGASSKPFGFGASATPRDTTPPKKEDSEVMMDESPTRPVAMDESNKPDPSKLNGFSFNLPGSSSPFGQNAQASAPFAFGQSSGTPSTLFGTKPEVKPAEKPSTPFSGFGQPAAPSTGFPFSQKTAENAATPASNPFSFNSPATPSANSAPFGFGAPQISQSSSFGQPASATAPVSPSPFGQPAGFAFGPTTPTAPAAQFTFTGSQPASPATGNAGLPAQNGPTGFAFGAPSAASAASSSPFGAPAALPSTGGALFTMGAAPPPPAGGRLLKKLPRRGGKR